MLFTVSYVTYLLAVQDMKDSHRKNIYYLSFRCVTSCERALRKCHRKTTGGISWLKNNYPLEFLPLLLNFHLFSQASPLKAVYQVLPRFLKLKRHPL